MWESWVTFRHSWLLIIEATAKLLAEKLPTTTHGMVYAEKSFNDISRTAWDKVIDFIKLHYFLSKRKDNDFWLDNVDPSTASDSLLEKLDYWRFNLPTQSDFSSNYEVFGGSHSPLVASSSL